MTTTAFPRRPRDTSHMDADVESLLDVLANGPQDRRILAMRMATTDRRMRRTVEEARRRGHLVVWLDGMYRIASTASDFEEWARREQRSRLGTLHSQLTAMTRTAARMWPAEQMRIAL